MSEDYRDEITGWRLYYLHRGRLCSPMMRELQPVAPDEAAICLHEEHEPPAAGCYCGWRIADNLDAIDPAAVALEVPVRLPPVLAKLREETPERADNAWGIPESALAEFDWPCPALVRVRGHGGVRRADEVADHEDLIRAVIEQDGTDRRVIGEGPGMWRAARVQIIGPVITGQSPRPYQFHPPRDGGGVIEHYGVDYSVSDEPWMDVFDAVADGWLPRPSNRAERRARKKADR